MDVIKHLKTVTNLNQYMFVFSNFASSKIELNMLTIQALNKIKSFEIEYFNKYEENGAAFKIFDLLLLNPPSKIWDFLGKELILLLQYWLNALRKHLIIHNNNWWTFLQSILKFIKDLSLKELKLNDIIVQETAGCLLDLATHTKPDINQRYKILCTLNACSVGSRREIRVALRSQFEIYFIKLATLLSSCGDAVFQYSIMETLLRWLLPRYVPEVRRDAAVKWFPNHLYDKETVSIFVERPWKDFFQDTRDFLNSHNVRSDLITSVICKKLIIGQIVVITGSEKYTNWLDINTNTQCLSVMLDPRLLHALGYGLQAEASEALIITQVNTDAAKLRKVGQEVSILVRTLEPAHLMPSAVSLKTDSKDINIVIKSECDLVKVDSALRRIFTNKYQVLFDIENAIPKSSQKNVNTRQDMSEEISTFCIPSERTKRMKTGYVVKSMTIGSEILSSSTSTKSLAQLHQKLEELPYYDIKYDRMKIPHPGLSRITEASESDAGRSCGSTFKYKSFGVCQKSTFQTEKSEAIGNKEVKKTKLLSTAVTDEESNVSCLFVATIGSADESVISETLERLPKNRNPENTIDVLVQEALNAKNVSDKNKPKTEVSREDNVPRKYVLKEITNENNTNKRKNCTVISNSTSEEIVEGTQFSNFDKINIREKFTMKENELFPVKVSNDKVEEFFSQHFSNNPVTEVIDPSLAKKHNETESEPSEEESRRIENKKHNEFNIDLEVEQCLKYCIDKICHDLDGCEDNLHEAVNIDKEPCIEENKLEELRNEDTKDNSDIKSPTVKDAKSIKNVTLTFKNTKKRNAKKTQRKLKIKFNELQATKIETTDTKKVSTNPDTSNTDDNKKIKRTIRKRKLYSPKVNVFDRCNENYEPEKITDIVSKTKTYSKARPITPYKDIEKERNEYRNKLRNKKSEAIQEILLSPKTKKMNDIFDTLKSDTNSNQRVTLVRKSNEFSNANVYNFSSDSEDEFKTTTVKHVFPKSVLEKKSNQNKKKTSRKNVKSKANVSIKKETLIDERMREAPPKALDTSLELRRSPRKVTTEPEPNIKTDHKMEVMDEAETKTKSKANNKKTNIKLEKKKKSPLKNEKKNLNKITNYIKYNESFDVTISPLPGLTVETMPNKNIGNVSASPTRLEKIKKIYVDKPEEFNHLNTTQNLLMDLDQTSEYAVRVIENVGKIGENSQDDSQSSRILRSQKKQSANKNVISKKNDSLTSIKKNKHNNKRRAEIEPTRYVIDISADSNSEKSINTVGILPITAHGDLELCCNDLPPNQDVLNKTIEPRYLEIEGQNQSIKDLYVQLQERLEDQKPPSTSLKNTNEIRKKTSPLRITKIPSDDYIRYLPSLRDSDSSNHSVDESDKPKSNVSKSVCTSKNKSKKSDYLNKNTRKSQISPIRLFDIPTYQTRSHSTSIVSDGVEQIRNLFYKSNNTKKDTKSILKSATRHSDASSKRDSVRDSVNRMAKRKSSELLDVIKKRKIDTAVSSPRISTEIISYPNINSWVDQCMPSTSTDGIKQSYDDNVQCILEKLDTTLVEIHHNTDRRFINTFVKTQQRFSDLKRIHKEVYDHMVTDINNKFKRLKEMTDEVFEDMKSKMRDVITEDRKQKKAMVQILKEDVQAVLDFNARKNK